MAFSEGCKLGQCSYNVLTTLPSPSVQHTKYNSVAKQGLLHEMQDEQSAVLQNTTGRPADPPVAAAPPLSIWASSTNDWPGESSSWLRIVERLSAAVLEGVSEQPIFTLPGTSSIMTMGRKDFMKVALLSEPPEAS